MKSVLLIYKNEGLAPVFESELQKAGYAVTPFFIHPINYANFRWTDILEKKFRGAILRDNQFVHRMYDRVFFRYCNKRLKELSDQNMKFDYCLSVHGELAPENVLSWAREVSGKMVDYQPDGISEKNEIRKYTKYYDQIFVFDPADITRYPELKAKSATNFFIEDQQTSKEKFDFFYVGALTDNRLQVLENLYHHFKNKFSAKFILGASPYDRRNDTEAVKFIRSHTSYAENLQMVKESRCLIDLKRPEHDGLSFRFFEAMNYNRKVITNNSSVKNYDFFHPDNIHITENFDDYNAIEVFMNRPVQEIPLEVKAQYAFKNWVNRLLNG